MAGLDKEIKVMMLKGEIGKSSYQLAVENLLFSGTLEEWINTFATPENYITREEFKKVTQEQYDELKANNQLVPNCYYLIIDDTTYNDIEEALDNLSNNIETIQGDIETIQGDMETIQGDIENLQSDVNNIISSHTFTTEATTTGEYTFEIQRTNRNKIYQIGNVAIIDCWLAIHIAGTDSFTGTIKFTVPSNLIPDTLVKTDYHVTTSLNVSNLSVSSYTELNPNGFIALTCSGIVTDTQLTPSLRNGEILVRVYGTYIIS